MMLATGKKALITNCYLNTFDESVAKYDAGTGPQLCAGKELAEAASKALGTTIEFENISE